jgi:hypothetical protein
VGARGLQHLLGQLPSWISNSEKEKMEWLNSILLELWPWWAAGRRQGGAHGSRRRP